MINHTRVVPIIIIQNGFKAT